MAVYVFSSVCTLLKTGKFKGCVTTEILIVDSTRPLASIFKLKSIKGVSLGILRKSFGAAKMEIELCIWIL